MQNFLGDRFNINVYPKLLLNNFLVLVSFCGTLFFIFAYTNQYREDGIFNPINGTFQTFNPIHRICSGEQPTVDFNPYLGLGTTYLITFLSALLGCKYTDSVFVNWFIHVTSYWIKLLLLLIVCRVKFKRAVIVSSFCLACYLLSLNHFYLPYYFLRDNVGEYLRFTSKYPIATIYPWTMVIMPGNSNMGLRSFLPYLSSLIILALIPLLQNKRRAFYSFLGFLAGTQFFWSNDYGIPSAISLLFVTILFIVRFETFKIANILRVLFFNVVGFLLIGSILTRNHLFQWITDNFLGVAGDQFWYFENLYSKITSLEDAARFYSSPFLIIYAIATIVVFIYSFFTRERDFRCLLLPYLSLTPLLAGTLLTLGGNVSLLYYTPAMTVSLFIIPMAIVLLLKKMKYLLEQTGRFHFSQFAQSNQQPQRRKSVTTFLSTSIIGFLIVFWGFNIYTAISIVHSQAAVKENPQLFYAKEMGGYLSRLYQTAYEKAQEIGRETQALPPTQRILSTYSSMIDLLAGSRNITGVDYIIHALGDSTRREYIEKFNSQKPEYITTIRRDFLPPTTDWIQSVNWWFYQEFVKDYELVDETFYSLIWKRMAFPQSIKQPATSCILQKSSPNSVNIALPLSDMVAAYEKSQKSQLSKDQAYYFDVSLSYHLDSIPTGPLGFAHRRLINVEQVNNSQPGLLYGIPPSHKDWHVMLEYRVGNSSSLHIIGLPKELTSLTIERCEGRLFSPASKFSIRREFELLNVSDAYWQRGVLTNLWAKMPPDSTMVRLKDTSLATSLYPGTRILFASGVERTVRGVSQDVLWISGEKLDPIKDGYPNKIVAIYR